MSTLPENISSSSKGLGVHKRGSEIYFYYKLIEKEKTELQVLSSGDGLSVQTFHKTAELKDREGNMLSLRHIDDFRIAELGAVNVLTYKEHHNGSSQLYAALSKDLVSWTRVSAIKGVGEVGMVVPNYYEQKKFVLIYGEHDIKVATSSDALTWTTKGEILIPATQDHWGTLSHILGTIIPMDAGLAVLYFARGIGGSHWSIHGIMLDKKNPEKILWQADTIWEHHQGWEGKKVEPIGMMYHDKQLYSYWDFAGEGIFAISHAAFGGIMNRKASFPNMELKRINENPVIKPDTDNFWESKATFNPAAMYERGKVHLVYRAIGDYDTSVLGYAGSKDGYTFDERLKEPAYVPTQSFEVPASGTPWSGSSMADISMSPYESGGGGYGGCEDPRITKINNRYYMTYVAYDGANPPRVALTSIRTDDFHAKKWNWDKPVLISPPGVVDKNCVIFPEKINGKYAILHRIFPNILLDFVDTLDFTGNTFLKGEFRIKPSRTLWDSRKVGAGPPPIKTKYGWLLIYHAVGEKDAGRYKVGAMLLDLKDPTIVLARTIIPILAPDHRDDNEGFKAGVVYPCGAVVKDDTLFVYYGGADTVVCGAYAHIDRFLEELLATGSTNMKPVFSYHQPAQYAQI